ncbi:MAG TPA: hypothetical protein VGG08_08350 [Solirubrobacteraceae bacterium]
MDDAVYDVIQIPPHRGVPARSWLTCEARVQAAGLTRTARTRLHAP